ncbi:MAG: acyl-CoA thioesterase [Tenericutes bacterium]|nr:acyl-CoA thioesterase [Mycoplasmatota bacterium]
MKSVLTIEPRYQETDQMGVIHHSVYPIWYEMGRVKFCDDIGIPFPKIEEQNISLAMVEMKSIFKKPSKFGETYTQRTLLIEFSGVQMEFRYELYDKNNELIHIGETRLVWLNNQFRPMNIEKTNPDMYKLFTKNIEK